MTLHQIKLILPDLWDKMEVTKEDYQQIQNFRLNREKFFQKINEVGPESRRGIMLSDSDNFFYDIDHEIQSHIKCLVYLMNIPKYRTAWAKDPETRTEKQHQTYLEFWDAINNERVIHDRQCHLISTELRNKKTHEFVQRSKEHHRIQMNNLPQFMLPSGDYPQVIHLKKTKNKPAPKFIL